MMKRSVTAMTAKITRRLTVLLLAGLCMVPLALSAPGDIVIPRKEGGMSVDAMPASVFPHWVHRIRYRCDACHLRLFEMQVGATEINMTLMAKNDSCATCHNGRDAFDVDFNSCSRCHRKPGE